MRLDGAAFKKLVQRNPVLRLRLQAEYRQRTAANLQMQAMPEVAVATPIAAGGALAVRGEASRSITLTGVEPGFATAEMPSRRRKARVEEEAQSITHS